MVLRMPFFSAAGQSVARSPVRPPVRLLGQLHRRSVSRFSPFVRSAVRPSVFSSTRPFVRLYGRRRRRVFAGVYYVSVGPLLDRLFVRSLARFS